MKIKNEKTGWSFEASLLEIAGAGLVIIIVIAAIFILIAALNL